MFEVDPLGVLLFFSLLLLLFYIDLEYGKTLNRFNAKVKDVLSKGWFWTSTRDAELGCRGCRHVLNQLFSICCWSMLQQPRRLRCISCSGKIISAYNDGIDRNSFNPVHGRIFSHRSHPQPIMIITDHLS